MIHSSLSVSGHNIRGIHAKQIAIFFKIMCFNTQSCRNKTEDVSDLITQGSYYLVFLTERWLRPTGDECEMAAVTPPGFTLKSVSRATGGGLAVLFRNSLVDCVKVSTKDLAFRSFEVCETRLCYQDQSVMVLCVYRPPPSRKNKLSNKIFLDEFPDLLES